MLRRAGKVEGRKDEEERKVFLPLCQSAFLSILSNVSKYLFPNLAATPMKDVFKRIQVLTTVRK